MREWYSPSKVVRRLQNRFDKDKARNLGLFLPAPSLYFVCTHGGICLTIWIIFNAKAVKIRGRKFNDYAAFLDFRTFSRRGCKYKRKNLMFSMLLPLKNNEPTDDNCINLSVMLWYGRQDLNLQPDGLVPKTSVFANFTTPAQRNYHITKASRSQEKESEKSKNTFTK